jgi:hypothetical protein
MAFTFFNPMGIARVACRLCSDENERALSSIDGPQFHYVMTTGRQQCFSSTLSQNRFFFVLKWFQVIREEINSLGEKDGGGSGR